MEIKNMIMFGAAVLLSAAVSCSKEWIPTPDPSQTKWVNRGPETEDPTPEPSEN